MSQISLSISSYIDLPVKHHSHFLSIIMLLLPIYTPPSHFPSHNSPSIRILHLYHEHSVLFEIVVVADDVGVIESTQDLSFVHGRISLRLCQVHEVDLLQDHVRSIVFLAVEHCSSICPCIYMCMYHKDWILQLAMFHQLSGLKSTQQERHTHPYLYTIYNPPLFKCRRS